MGDGEVMKKFGELVRAQHEDAERVLAIVVSRLSAKYDRKGDPRFERYVQGYGEQFVEDVMDLYISHCLNVPRDSALAMTEDQFVSWVERTFLEDALLRPTPLKREAEPEPRPRARRIADLPVNTDAEDWRGDYF